jgi:hypothetical protein
MEPMIATLLLMLLGSQAEATPGFDDPATTIWVKIEELRNSSIYIRPDTIKQISPTERSVWRKTIFVKPEDKVKERLVKNVIDCVAETITVTAITAYDKSGKVITSGAIEKSNQETDPVTPDSVSETIMNAVCAAGENEDEQLPSTIAMRVEPPVAAPTIGRNDHRRSGSPRVARSASLLAVKTPRRPS